MVKEDRKVQKVTEISGGMSRQSLIAEKQTVDLQWWNGGEGLQAGVVLARVVVVVVAVAAVV